jgi:hypothetical protein
MTAESAEKAVANAREITKYEPGYCLRYVRESWRIGSLYASAIEAWNGSRDKHPGDRNPPYAAPCYYRIGQYGHVVIATNRIRSTDCHSSGYVNEEDLSWPEKAWGATYLGWAGDLNGIDLPLEGIDEMELTDPITEWSPDEGSSGEKTTVGKTLNQARGYAEDGYQRVKALQKDVDDLANKVDKILDKLT